MSALHIEATVPLKEGWKNGDEPSPMALSKECSERERKLTSERMKRKYEQACCHDKK